MKRISAADNTIIEILPDSWRLIATGESGEEHGLVEAGDSDQVRYVADFAQTRRLPASGALPANYVWQVVMGWSRGDEAWHLGLLLASDLADARGSRWCELAHWPDPDATVFEDLVKEAGMALARTINRPFNLIPPRRIEIKPVEPEAPLPELPLSLGGWRLENGGGHLQFVRSPKWSRGRLARASWYTFWMTVYVALSVATLNSDLALPNSGTMLPNPNLLPYFGLAAAVILILMTLYILYELLTYPDRIVVDEYRKYIVALRGARKRWQIDGNGLESVYVTQVVDKKGKKHKIRHGEINLHRSGNDFYRVIEQQEKDEKVQLAETPDEKIEETIVALTSSKIRTELQAAGLYLAKALGELPVWYDQRTK
jgi:hypothetical protein